MASLATRPSKAAAGVSQQRAFGAARPAVVRRSALVVRAEAAAGRRDVLLAGAAAAAATLLPAGSALAVEREMPVSSLSTFQKAAQRKAYLQAAEGALRGVFTAEDARSLLALCLHDAATYDAASRTGGFDGSILLASEELGRPENAYLKPIADKLRGAKAAVDAATPQGSGPISYADLMVLATKVATQASWREIKLSRTVTTSGGDIIATVYGTEWPTRLGRLDSSSPAPAGRIPAEDAPVAEIASFMKQLGVKPDAGSGPFTPKPPFWERPTFVIWPAASKDPAATEARFAAEDPANFGGPKADYDRSRKTLTRTDYEVDFINNFAKLTDGMGATFAPDAYLHPETTLQLKF